MYKRMIILCALVLAVSAVANGGQGSIRRNHNAIRNEYIVVLDDAVPVSQVDRVAADLSRQYGGTIRKTWKYALKGFVISMSEAGAEALSHHRKVALVEENATLTSSVSQDTNLDPVTGAVVEDYRLWHLDRLDQMNATLDKKYNYCTTGTAVSVYVVDSGVMASHSEFLPNQVKPGVNTSGDDPDIYPATSPCNGWPSPVDPADPDFPNYRLAVLNSGHGTSVASLVAGQKVGVAKNASIVPVKVHRCDTLMARAWKASHVYHVNDLIGPEQNGRYWRCTAVSGSGTSGIAHPNFLPASETVTDNGVTWTNTGPSPARLWKSSHAYRVADMIFVPDQGKYWQVTGVTGDRLSGAGPRPAFLASETTVVDNHVTWTIVPGFVPPAPEGSIDTMIAGIEWILDPSQNPNPIDATHPAIATFSLFLVNETPGLSSFEEVIENLVGRGVAVFASANNQDDTACNTSPGRLSRNNPDTSLQGKVITVGGSMPVTVGSTNKDARWFLPNPNDDSTPYLAYTGYPIPDFSNVNTRVNYSRATIGSNAGACVTLFAPAQRIASARLTGPNDYRDRNGMSNDGPIPPFASGTSFAAPLAAGAAARFLETRPSATVDDVHSAIMNSAVLNVMEDSTAYPLNLPSMTGTPNVMLRATDVWIYDSWPKQATISAGQSTALSVNASGPGTLTYQWYSGNPGDTTTQVDTGSSISVSPQTTTSYWVRVSTSCGGGTSSVDSRAATVIVSGAPIIVQAAATSTTSVHVTWNASPGATSYDVFRASQGSPFNPDSPVTNTANLFFDDAGRTPGKAYAYKVRPRYDQTPGSFSNVDLATTILFAPITAPQSLLTASHILDLRKATNAIDDLAGVAHHFADSALLETSLKPASGPPRFGQASDFTELRDGINQARSSCQMGLPSISFGETLVQNGVVRASHIADLQAGAK